MSAQAALIETLALTGLEIAPPQVCGAFRLVPLLRPHARPDLRLTRRALQDDLTVVSLDGPLLAPGVKYCSFVPHGLILSWSNDGSAVAAFGGQMGSSEGKRFSFGSANVRVLPRMAKRMTGSHLRFLPMHLAMEGFLGLYFGGPEIAWSEYSRHALRQGLSPRWETAYGGGQLAGFEDALRTFEIHEHQVGVLVFVAEVLASAFVVPTPDDYRALHSSLLEDFYGELIYQYGLLYDAALPLDISIRDSEVHTLADLRAALAGIRADWAAFQGGVMAGDLLGRAVQSQKIYQAGPFTLQRFLTDLDPAHENHIGEAILRDDGTLEYLKTFRLSAAQTRRAYLLSRLAAQDWNLDQTAAHLQTTRDELVHRFEKAGFGYLLAEPVRVASRAAKRAEQRVF